AAQTDTRQPTQTGRQGRPERQGRRGLPGSSRAAIRRARVRRAAKSVAARRIPHEGTQTMKLPKYVQAWVDGRDGRADYYLRRRGFPRVRLPGLPWSPSFMAAYEAAMSGPRTAIGAGRVKPGSVAAVIADYFDSQHSSLRRAQARNACAGESSSASAPPMA